MTTLTPRAVPVLSPFRWAWQSVQLIGRDLTAFAAVLVFLYVVAFFLSASTLAVTWILLATFNAVIILCSLLDSERSLTTSRLFVLAISRQSLWQCVCFSGIVMMMHVLMVVLTQNWLFFYSSKFSLTNGPLSPRFEFSLAVFDVMFLLKVRPLSIALMGMTLPVISGLFHFSCVQLGGAKYWTAYRLNWQATAKNPVIAFTLMIFLGWLVPFGLLEVPMLTPFFVLWLAGFVYVGYRDIFLGKSENSKPVSVTAYTPLVLEAEPQ